MFLSDASMKSMKLDLARMNAAKNKQKRNDILLQIIRYDKF